MKNCKIFHPSRRDPPLPCTPKFRPFSYGPTSWLINIMKSVKAFAPRPRDTNGVSRDNVVFAMTDIAELYIILYIIFYLRPVLVVINDVVRPFVQSSLSLSCGKCVCLNSKVQLPMVVLNQNLIRKSILNISNFFYESLCIKNFN